MNVGSVCTVSGRKEWRGKHEGQEEEERGTDDKEEG